MQNSLRSFARSILLATCITFASNIYLDAAPISIDTFNVPGPWATYNTPVGPGTIRVNDSGPSILGQRDMIFGAPGLSNLGDAVGIGTATFGTHTGQGVLDISFNGSTTTKVTLFYDNFGTQDFSSDAGILLNVLAYNNGSVNSEHTVTLTTGSGNLVGKITFPNVPVGPQSFLIPFSAFTGNPAGLASVTAITLDINSNNSSGFDFTLDSIAIAAVPEPSTLLLFGALMAGGVVWVRKKRQTAMSV